MSNKPHYCTKCQVDGKCESVMPFDAEHERNFAVSWKCPRCEERSLVISPVGPWLAPAPGMCLQCGHERVVEGRACPSCGINIADVLTAEDAIRSDDDLLEAARTDFAQGTCRRGLTLVNHVLCRSPNSVEAWSIKAQFFEYLGFQRALNSVMQEAARLKDAEVARRDTTGGKRWWQFWR